jgi:biopolymer transport protein ExbD
MSLPGTIPQAEALELPDEAQIEILPAGELLLNQMPVAGPDDAELSGLLAVLVRLREAAEASKSEALVTIVPHRNCRHQRIVDVLNVSAKAEIAGVTFAPPSEGGEG